MQTKVVNGELCCGNTPEGRHGQAASSGSGAEGEAPRVRSAVQHQINLGRDREGLSCLLSHPLLCD